MVPNLGVLLVASVFNQPIGKQYGKQGHAIPNTRPSSGITNHNPDAASSDRSKPPRAGGLLRMSFRLSAQLDNSAL
jgi:hypothetical protein